MSHPVFLMVQIPAAVAAQDYLAAAAALASEHAGKVLASVEAGAVECLEAGTPAAAILLLEFAETGRARDFWASPTHQEAFAHVSQAEDLVALIVNGLPYEGLPEMLEIPTLASVKPPPGRGPRAFMIVQGTGSDQARMDEYRDIILPMIAEQGAYYSCFEIDGQVDLLAGEWSHGIFAISRWPDHAAGHAFWDSERYQKVAIPTRTGAGNFLVHFFTGASG